MGKGGLDLPWPFSAIGAKYPGSWLSGARRSEKFGGNVTTDVVHGSQFPPHSSASQSLNPAGSSVVVEKLQGMDLAAKSGLPTPASGVLKELPNFLGKGTERTASGVLYPIWKACRIGVSRESQGGSLKIPCEALEGAELVVWISANWVHSQHPNLRREICDYILQGEEEAGKSSSKGNLAESSDGPHAKGTKLAGSKNFPGVRRRKKTFGSHIGVPGMKNKCWLGTYKTAEAAAQARAAAANWLATHSGRKFLNDEELDELKQCAKKAGGHLSDYRSHHNVASPDLSPALTSLKGQAVASPEHVSQRGSPAHENFSPELDWSLLDNFLGSEEVGLNRKQTPIGAMQ
jgi:hypothetical protein